MTYHHIQTYSYERKDQEEQLNSNLRKEFECAVGVQEVLKLDLELKSIKIEHHQMRMSSGCSHILHSSNTSSCSLSKCE